MLSRLNRAFPLFRLTGSVVRLFFFLICIDAVLAAQNGVAALVPLRVHAGTGLILLVEEYCTSRYHWKEIARINGLEPPYRLKAGQEILVPEELLKVKNLSGRIANVHGGVFLLHPDNTMSPVKSGDAFRPGQTIVTNRGGFAYVIFPDNRFARIGSDSRFGITYMVRMVDGNMRAEFSLQKGKVVHAVREKLENNESYRTRTPVAITGVRGTEYRVKVAGEERSSVETLKGKVLVDGGKLGGRIVPAGKGTWVRKGQEIEQPQPLPPIPTPPVMQAVYKKLPVVVTTQKRSGIREFRLRVTTDPDGTNTILEKRVPAGEKLTLLALEDGHYHAFLSGIGENGLEGPAAAAVRFQIRTVPGAPIFTSPYRGKTGFDSSWKVAWMRDENAAEYRIQLAPDEHFSRLLEDRTVEESEYTFGNLEPGQYFVRVQAIAPDGFASLYSLTDSWTIRKQPELGSLAPAGSESGELRFAWKSMGDDITYDLQIGTSRRFGKLVVEEAGLVESHYLIQKQLEPGSYYVRLRGVLADGQKSPWSPPQVLKVEQPPFSWKDGTVLLLFLGAALL